MMLRVVSSMNSTRTCVTPPREPEIVSKSSRIAQSITPGVPAEDVGRGKCCDVPVRPRTLVTLTSLTGTFEASMIAVVGSVICILDQRWRELDADYDGDRGVKGVDVGGALVASKISLTFRPQGFGEGKG